MFGKHSHMLFINILFWNMLKSWIAQWNVLSLSKHHFLMDFLMSHKMC